MRNQMMVFLVGGSLLALTGAAATAEEYEGLGWSKTKPEKGRFVATEHGYMIPYTMKIPGSDVSFEMIPIPGGKFLMGSPDSEAGRQAHEGPQVEVSVQPFWMGKHEVTWKEYHQFMNLYDAFKEFVMLRSILASRKEDEVTVERQKKLRELLKQYEALSVRIEQRTNPLDAITAPTKLYEPDTTYQYGDKPNMPAVTVTQYAAKHYTKWLSKISGIDYRLPREAEWEYACRAGTSTAYHFGDDPEKLDDYGWFYDNGEESLHEVGQKKPNPWGLYDIYGNAAEWVLDGLTEDGYQRLAGKQVDSLQSVAWSEKAFPRVLRGGHFDADADECRSAARLGSSDEEWKTEDPNLPLSPWWYTTEPSHGVGFRLLRPLKSIPDEERKKVWEADSPSIKLDVQIRMEEGRGAKDSVDAQLPAAIKQLETVKKELKLESN